MISRNAALIISWNEKSQNLSNSKSNIICIYIRQINNYIRRHEQKRNILTLLLFLIYIANLKTITLLNTTKVHLQREIYFTLETYHALIFFNKNLYSFVALCCFKRRKTPAQASTVIKLVKFMRHANKCNITYDLILLSVKQNLLT